MDKHRLGVLLATFVAATGSLCAQGPVITSIATNPSPPAPGASFVMTATGTGFCQSAQLYFDDLPLSTQVTPSLQLIATVPGSMTAGLPGFHDVLMVNFSGGSCSNFGDSNIVKVYVVAGLNIENRSLPQGDVGVGYNAGVSVTGGQPPYIYSIQGQLPPGIQFSSASGGFSGVPTQAGTFDFIVLVRDQNPSNQTDSLSLSITVRPGLQIATSTLPLATVNQAYSSTLLPSGGLAPYSWTLVSGTPPGITLSTAGVLSGTPTQSGDFNLLVRVSDRNATQATRNLTLSVRSGGAPNLQITTASLPAAAPNVFYTFNLQGTGGTQPYIWTTNSTLPSGISLSSAGLLSGTTQQTGTFSINFTLRDFNQQVQAVTLPLTVTADPLRFQTASIPAGSPGTFYSTQFAAAGGTPGYIFNTNSALPTGITLSSGGLLSGTPQQSGTFPLVVILRDSLGHSIEGNFTLTISNNLQIQTTTLPAGTPNVFYSTTFQATGGSGTYSWSTSSPLPTGVTLSSGGILSGVPLQSGNFTLNVVVSDGQRTAIGGFTLTIGSTLQITSTFLPTFTPSAFYAFTMAATGGSQPYTWSTNSFLPFGITLNANGTLSGVTQQTGTFPLAIVVQDATGLTAQANLTLGSASSIQITTFTLPVAQPGQFYSAVFNAIGGSAPYTWSVVDALPAGFTLDPSSGLLSGTSFFQTTFNFTVLVRDTLNQTATRAFTLVIGNAVNITTAALKPGATGVPYSDFLSAIGGSQPYQWLIVDSSVPGLTLDAVTGTLSGLPSLTGFFNLTIKVTDSAGASTTKTFVVSINAAFKITTDTIPTATVGVFYQTTFTASDGTLPFTWSMTGSTTPGLGLNSATGLLAGAPTEPGVFQFTVLVTDLNGQVASKPFVLIVNQTVQIAPESLPSGTLNLPYTATLTAVGGSAPYTFVLTAGSIPGLTLGFNGVFSGSPTQAGTFPITVRASDAFGSAGIKRYTVVVQNNLQLGPGSLPDGVTGVTYSAVLVPSGGVQPFTFKVTAGSPPDGLALDASSGVISGVPSTASTFTFTIELSDASGQKATRSYTVNVVQGVKISQSGTLPSGIIGSAYATTLTATGGAAPYTWRLSQADLPAGLSLGSTGIISGTPTGVGRFPFTAEVSDSNGRKATTDLMIPVSAPLLRFTSSETLPAATAGINYAFSPVVTGGLAPYQWSLSGAPAELQINSTTGAISGRLITGGTLPLTIRVTDSLQTVASQVVSLRVDLPEAPGATFSGVSATGSPSQQISPRLALAQTYPLPLAGEMTLVFTPTSGSDDPAVQFSSGGRRVTFTVPSGETAAVFSTPSLGLQTGTVAGTITLTARYLMGTTDVTPTPAPTTRITIPNTAPVITSLQATRTATGFELVIIGYATSRELTSAAIRLTTAGSVSGSDFTVNLAASSTAWYQSTAAAPFGSLLKITIPFNIQGTSGTVSGASVTLTNPVGSSQAATVTF